MYSIETVWKRLELPTFLRDKFWGVLKHAKSCEHDNFHIKTCIKN